MARVGARTSRAKRERDADDIARISATLEEELREILVHDFRVRAPEFAWHSPQTLADVVTSAHRAMEDMRNHFSGSISIIKHISNIMFWLIKLKPINGSNLSADGYYLDAADVNERIALYWGMATTLDVIEAEKLSELVPAKDADKVRRIFDYYLFSDMYGPKGRTKGERTTKFAETTFYFRFKKVTAINIYEMFLHMFVSLKALDPRGTA